MVYYFLCEFLKNIFSARLSNAEWAGVSVSNTIWPVVNTAGI